MAQTGSSSSSANMITIGRFKFPKRHVTALEMPLPPDSYFQHSLCLDIESELSPAIDLPPWPSHIAILLATVLQYLIERSQKVDTHHLDCHKIFASRGDTIARYLRNGFELFSSNSRAKLFNIPWTNPFQNDSSLFTSIWTLFAETWYIIQENHPKTPWRDNLIKNTLFRRGDIEIRLYLFHVCAVEYFTTVALARKTLADGINVGMTFGEQEYAQWCLLVAAALLLFKGRRLEQMEVLEDTLLILGKTAPSMEVDVNREIQRLLQRELQHKYNLVHCSNSQVWEQYDVAYSHLARRVVSVYQILDPSSSSLPSAGS